MIFSRTNSNEYSVWKERLRLFMAVLEITGKTVKAIVKDIRGERNELSRIDK